MLKTPQKKSPGIQPGQIAGSDESKALHSSIKIVQTQIFDSLRTEYPQLTWKSSLKGEELLAVMNMRLPEGERITGISPDGGIFFWNDTAERQRPLLVVEMKNQGSQGNAIERWFKNYSVIKSLSPEMAYLTFCTGEGATQDGVMSRNLNNAFLEWGATHTRCPHMRKWNHLYDQGPSLFRSVQGFDLDTIYNLTRTLLLRTIENTKWQ